MDDSVKKFPIKCIPKIIIVFVIKGGCKVFRDWHLSKFGFSPISRSLQVFSKLLRDVSQITVVLNIQRTNVACFIL